MNLSTLKIIPKNSMSRGASTSGGSAKGITQNLFFFHLEIL